MHRRHGFGLVEPLFVLLVVGVGFSLLALWTTRGRAPRAVSVRRPAAEGAALAAYLPFVVAFLTWGIPLLRRPGEVSLGADLAIVGAKLGVFVLAPLILWRWMWGYRAGDFTAGRLGLAGDWRPALWMSGAFVVLQLVFGKGLPELRQADPGVAALAIGLPLAFVWLFVEVGVVEEFFFRGLLQSRIAALARSEDAAIVLMALLFGLAHAPGLYLRPEMTGENVGSEPSLLLAVGYSIVITSVTGFPFGILWSRTRNLVALAAIHAAADLVPNLAELLRSWGLR